MDELVGFVFTGLSEYMDACVFGVFRRNRNAFYCECDFGFTGSRCESGETKFQATTALIKENVPLNNHLPGVEVSITIATHSKIYSETTDPVYLSLIGENGEACVEYMLHGHNILRTGQ